MLYQDLDMQQFQYLQMLSLFMVVFIEGPLKRIFYKLTQVIIS